MLKLIYVIFLANVFCEQSFSEYRKAYKQYQKQDNVVVLDKNNFDQVLGTVDRVLVEFYAPWCKHCQELSPQYTKIAETLQTQEKNILIAKLNAHEEKELASKYQIKGYPTLILFNKDQQEKYEGLMKQNEILNWLNRKISRKARQIYTLEEFQKMQKKRLAVLYMFPEGDIQAHRRLQQVAQYYDTLPFFYTHSQEMKEETDCVDYFCFYVYRNFDEGVRAMKNKDSFQVQSMLQFVDNLRYPYVEELNEEVMQRYIHRNESTMVFFGDDKESNEYKIFSEFAKQNRKTMRFSIVSFRSELDDMLAQFSDVKLDETPTVRILKLSAQTIDKFKVDQITHEALNEATQKFLKNELEAMYKSEEIPEENNEIIKVLVGKNFEETVKNDKYVFVDMYAPSCDECMTLQDIYQRLAEEYQNNQNVEFYKIDVSKNENQSMKLQGLPTFRLYKPNKSEYKEYDGPRTYEEIKGFIDIELNEDDINTDL